MRPQATQTLPITLPASAELICVDPAEVENVWPHVEKLIGAAIDRVDFSNFRDVESEVYRGGALLWIAWDGERIRAAAVTAINNRVCEIVACGGRGLREWIHLIKDLENYAREENCERMRIIGRTGWKRVLPDYKQSCVVLERLI